jgi:hypothetical protein
MNNSDAYRMTAETCAKLAETAEDTHARLILLNMAEAWLRLADHVEQRERRGRGGPLGTDTSSDHNVPPK